METGLAYCPDVFTEENEDACLIGLQGEEPGQNQGKEESFKKSSLKTKLIRLEAQNQLQS